MCDGSFAQMLDKSLEKSAPSGCRFYLNHRITRGPVVAAGALAAQTRKVPPRKARQVLCIDEDEPVITEEMIERCDGEPAQAQVSNSIKSALLDHGLEVRDLDDCDAVVLQQVQKSFDEFAEVGNELKHVVGDDDIG